MRTVIALVLALVATSCTGDDDSPAADSSSASASTEEPGTTSSTTTTTTLPPPPEATRVPMTGLPDQLDSSTASQLLPAQRGRGHVLVGMSRTAGSPAVPATWESADGINWDSAPAPAPPDSGTAQVLGAAYTTDGLALAGSQVVAGGAEQAAVWVAADTRNFPGPAEIPAGSRRSAIEAVVDSPAGLIAAGWVDDGTTHASFVALRASGGTWTEATVPALPSFNVWDAAAAGATVVIVGNDSSVMPSQAMALVSTDGGATFGVADTSLFAGAAETNLGAVEVTPSGFLALACAPTPTGRTVALARSVDGVTWTRQDIALDGDDVNLEGAECDSLSVEGDVAYVGHGVGWTHVLTVQPDGTATATRVDPRVGQHADGTPLSVPLGDGQLLAISRDHGGFSGTTQPAGTASVGLPTGASSVRGVNVEMTSGGVVARAELFPHHFLTSDGGEGWRWYYRWFSGVDGATLTYDQDAPEALAEVVATPIGDVGVGELDEDAEDDASLFRGATEGFIRRPGGAWESGGAIASGPALEQVTALTVTSSGAVVGVGYALTYDEAVGQTLQPLIRSTVDGVTWAAEVIGAPVPADALLQSVCARPDGSVVAWGTQSDGATSRAFGVQRAIDGTWTIIPTAGLEATSVACAVTATGRTVLRLAGPNPTLVYSDDGTAFVSAETSQLTFDDYSIAQLVVVDGGLVGVGTAQGPADDDALVVISTDEGATWEVFEVLGLDGLGDQRATGVAVTGNGDLLVVGIDNGAPVGWRIEGSDL